MGERMLSVSPEETDVARKDQGPRPDSPAVRLLDALRAGNMTAALAECGETTRMAAESVSWSCEGKNAIGQMMLEARERFPGLTFESSARHVGFGIVIEEARVQDAAAVAEEEAAAAAGPVDDATEPEPQPTAPDSTQHPMWDAPAADTRRGLSVWRDRPDTEEPPAALNMPVRLTVKHDDLQVHEITLSFPAALFKRALGLHVDPFEMSLSEVQSAFIAPVGAGFTTHTLARPELTLVPPAVSEPEPVPARIHEEPRRRGRRVLVPLVLAILAVAAGAGWWAVQGSNGTDVASPPVSSPKPHATPTHSVSKHPQPTKKPVTSPPTRKPNVTLKSDLAFGFNSSNLSGAAKKAIAKVARQVRRAGLTGKIYVDGYTDNIGSAAYGKVLSQKRADAVASYLRSHLGNANVTVVPVGHGESHPIASNATSAGQAKNRRVTITLPKP
jgi:outer membrane protein OmpA-like peptidoglycan-associated protein